MHAFITHLVGQEVDVPLFGGQAHEMPLMLHVCQRFESRLTVIGLPACGAPWDGPGLDAPRRTMRARQPQPLLVDVVLLDHHGGALCSVIRLTCAGKPSVLQAACRLYPNYPFNPSLRHVRVRLPMRNGRSAALDDGFVFNTGPCINITRLRIVASEASPAPFVHATPCDVVCEARVLRDQDCCNADGFNFQASLSAGQVHRALLWAARVTVAFQALELRQARFHVESFLPKLQAAATRQCGVGFSGLLDYDMQLLQVRKCHTSMSGIIAQVHPEAAATAVHAFVRVLVAVQTRPPAVAHFDAVIALRDDTGAAVRM